MRVAVRFTALLFFATLLSQTSRAQFFKFGSDKMVSVRIAHPPTVGLTVKRIAFGNPTGPCAEELVERMLLPDFRGNHVDVIERQNLDQILAEHAMSRNQEGAAQDKVALGRILGPSVLIFVKTYECRPDKERLVDTSQRNLNGSVRTVFISRTRVAVRGAVESVNLTTGQVMDSNSFQAQQEKENTNDAGPPEFPAEDEVRETALRDAASQIHNIFFPFVAVKSLQFYDDKDCGLKQIYELYTRGDHDGALKLADTSLEDCKTSHKNDKQLARAIYDAGLTHLLQQDYEKAAELLTQAEQFKGAEAASRALSACHEAQIARRGLQDYQVKLAQIPEPAPIMAATAPPPTPPGAAQAAALPKPDIETPKGAPKPSIEERLQQLDKLLKQGLITKKQYDDKKAQILSEM